MSTVEDRLRDALRERAARAPIDPDAWPRTVARSRRRRPGRRWLRAGAPVAAAASIVAIVIAVASIVGTAPGGGTRGTPSSASASSSASSSASASARPCTVDRVRLICASAVVQVKQGSGAQATVTSFYFGYVISPRTGLASRSLDFCAMVSGPRRPSGTSGGGNCTESSLDAGELASSAGQALDVQYGLAARQVTSVTAVLTNGRRVPGVVVSGRGFPDQAWQVRYPPQDAATLLFFDSAGHQVSKLLMPAIDVTYVLPQASYERVPSGGIRMFSTAAVTMTTFLVKGSITFVDSVTSRGVISNSWLGGFPAAGWPAVTALLGSGTYFGGNECFGYVHAGVARVVIRLSNGFQTTVPAFRPGWPGSGLRLFAAVLPGSLFPEHPADSGDELQGVITAYDAAGHVMAQEPLISTAP
jgi:hypothetical protein